MQLSHCNDFTVWQRHYAKLLDVRSVGAVTLHLPSSNIWSSLATFSSGTTEQTIPRYLTESKLSSNLHDCHFQRNENNGPHFWNHALIRGWRLCIRAPRHIQKNQDWVKEPDNLTVHVEKCLCMKNICLLTQNVAHIILVSNIQNMANGPVGFQENQI